MALTNARVVLALWSAAALWPAAYGALSYQLMSPIERAIFESWCGAAAHAQALLGHCAVCWAGSAALLLAGLATALFSPRQSLRAAPG